MRNALFFSIAVRDLGVHLDADLTMTAHVTATARACFAALRQIRRVKNSDRWHAMLCWHWYGHWWL